MTKNTLDIPLNPTPCVFESIYFMDKNSSNHGKPISLIRRRLGQQLALEEPLDNIDKNNSIVIAVPSSSLIQAEGFSAELDITCLKGAITKNPLS